MQKKEENLTDYHTTSVVSETQTKQSMNGEN